MEPDFKISKSKNTLCSPSPCWMDVLSTRAALFHHGHQPHPPHPCPGRSSWCVGEAPSVPVIPMYSGSLGAAGTSSCCAHSRLESSGLPMGWDRDSHRWLCQQVKVCLAKQHGFLLWARSSGLLKALQHLCQTVELQHRALGAASSQHGQQYQQHLLPLTAPCPYPQHPPAERKAWCLCVPTAATARDDCSVEKVHHR